jgi:hypothetical protein
MFLTADALVYEFGINDKIAKFFVDREPPIDNLYWKDKLLYLRPQPGYIFLPLIVDLFYRLGVSKEEVLSESFISVLEQIGHYSAQEEVGLITKEETVQQCARVVENISNEIFLKDVIDYLNGVDNYVSKLATPFKALHRGDVFLFSICVLSCNREKKIQLVKAWFALISTLLLLDDSEDYTDDLEKGEENAFIESGANQEGFDNIKALLAKDLSYLSTINPAMSEGLHRKFIALADKPGIKEFLKG